VRQSEQITPTISPSSMVSSQTRDAGELKGGAGRWQRRHADVGSFVRSLRSRPTVVQDSSGGGSTAMSMNAHVPSLIRVMAAARMSSPS